MRNFLRTLSVAVGYKSAFPSLPNHWQHHTDSTQVRVFAIIHSLGLMMFTNKCSAGI